MKLTFFLLFLTLMQVSAAGLAQKITIAQKNISLKELFKQINRQSGYNVFWSPDLIRNTEKITVNFNKTPLEEVLQFLFKDSNLTYEIESRSIIIKKKDYPAIVHIKFLDISGKVLDQKGQPLPGVSVKLMGTNLGTVTNSEGNYVIKTPNGEGTLIFSYVGFTPQEVAVNNRKQIDVTLIEASAELNEMVVVGYGTQSKKTLTGSIASVKGDEITVAPLASTANTLAGRLPGLISLQSSGQPGADAAKLSIRGFGSALIIVDGIESDFNNIDPNAIESISILKDAAASVYGARAGNGVILVTTKRGQGDKPVISLNSSATLQGITVMPNPASAGQYAEMQSEAWLQAGKPVATVPYTPEQIQKYYEGNDPLYPNTNWYDVLIRDWAPQQQHNLSVRGGSERIKYYGFIGYLNQGSIWKNNGGDYSRYNLQSNIDAKITDELSLQLDLSSVVEDRKTTWRPQVEGSNTVWQDFWNTRPNYPATLPDPTKVSFANGGGTGGAHVVTNRNIAGYNDFDDQNIKGTISLNYNFKGIEGLSAKALVNVLQDYGTNKNFSRPVEFYTYDPGSAIYTLAGSLGSKASLTVIKDESRVITQQLSLKYDRTFRDIHQLTGLALYESIDYSSNSLSGTRVNFLTPAIDQLYAGSTSGMSNFGSATEMGRKSYVGRLNYTYKSKYLLEAIFRADASAKFPSEKRWGYFPGLSAGWRIGKEQFLEKWRNLDELKLRVSYGESGNDGVGNFQYLSGYKYGNTYVFGSTAQPGLVSTGLANPDLTWEKVKIYNSGVDFSFWNRKLYGEFDAFYRIRNGIPTTKASSLPSSFGANLPPENLNSLNDRGFELSLGTTSSVNNFFWDISGNLSWSRAKWDHYEEPEYADPLQAKIYRRSGNWTDKAFGYVSDGLFTSQAEIDQLPFDLDGQDNKTLKQGDIKYKDLNQDGVLDWKDQIEIGKGTTPHWILGLNMNLKYERFDLSALFQGAFGYYNYIVLQHAEVPPAIKFEERWTVDNNNANALVPRLGGANTNSLYSDFYYKNAGYIRLKVLSVGYNLPQGVLNRLKLGQLRAYMAGTNLLTFDKLKKYSTDPEAPSGNSGYYYPQQKTITFGINLSF